MKSLHRAFLALLSGVLLSIPFFRWGTGLVMMVALVPLLLLEDEIASGDRRGPKDSRNPKDPRGPKDRRGYRARGRSVWAWSLLAFAPFILLTSYWVWFAAWVGMVGAVIVNSLYMSLVFWLFHVTRRRLGDRLGYASLVVYWLTFEFLYLRALVNFPWQVMGNGFANDILLVQWYEATGTLGGSLWALLMNIAVFRLIKGWVSSCPLMGRADAGSKGAGSRATDALRKYSFSITRGVFRENRSRVSWVVAIFLIPFLYSVIRYVTYEEPDDPHEIVVLQPNIDPYKKFIEMPQSDQTSILLALADSMVTPSTDYIVGPETFINNGVWISSIKSHPEFRRLERFLEDYPGAKLVMGATTLELYRDPSDFTRTSKLAGSGPYRFDSYNSAFQMDRTGEIPLYHKSKLVVGVEFMPYTRALGFLEKLTVRLGGAFRGHATQAFRETFVSPQDSTRVAPVICWESIFGEYVTEYVSKEGANFLFIITNDGWWRNTPGHRQHNSYARLRAIENRRSIARSANTGISCLIDQRGREIERLGWWVRSGIRGTLNSNDQLTFYTRHGDYIGRVSALLAVILLLYTAMIRIIRKET